MLCCDLAFMDALHKSFGIALRILIAAACCLGIWQSLQLARADLYFQRDTDQSIRTAISLVPDGWPYYMRLAQFDRANARDLLSTSLRLNPYDAQADIELGLQYEADGDYAMAEKQLHEAYSVDHTYLPRWSLANYYFRRDKMPEFWAWARSAAGMPADDIGALLELCWRAAPDAETITASILSDKPEFLRQYINFLIAKDQPRAAGSVAPHLLNAGDTRSDLSVLLSVINRLVAANEPSSAEALWNELARLNWVVADSTVPNNAGFLRAPIASSFDWSLPEYVGLHSWPGASGLQTEFSGSEPEDCVIAEQYVVLKPGNYALNFSYRTSGIAAGSGLRWQIVDPKSQRVLAESSDLSSGAVKRDEVGFALPETSLLQLRLNYRRTLGTVRVSGMLNVESVGVEQHPNL